MSQHRRTCSSCPFTSENAGAMFHHQAACSRKKRLRETVEADLVEQEANAIRIKTHDDVGRKLWLTAHNDICETCGGTGNLLLCSYCNTAWHFLVALIIDGGSRGMVDVQPLCPS